MVDKSRIRLIAESERLMDQGKVPWVWAPTDYHVYDRLPVTNQIMEELGLEHGQTINFIILDAISDLSKEILAKRLEELAQSLEDAQLDENFDFRSMMNEDDH